MKFGRCWHFASVLQVMCDFILCSYVKVPSCASMQLLHTRCINLRSVTENLARSEVGSFREKQAAGAMQKQGPLPPASYPAPGWARGLGLSSMNSLLCAWTKHRHNFRQAPYLQGSSLHLMSPMSLETYDQGLGCMNGAGLM